MDCALVRRKVVEQVWRDTSREKLLREGLSIRSGSQVVEFEPGRVVAGMLWDGKELTVPPRPET